MASWAEDQERSERYDELLRQDPGFMPDPKPARRVKADSMDWERLRLMMTGGCQVCGSEGWMLGRSRPKSYIGLSLHHIVPRSQGGDDVPENLAVLCGHGTVGCHGDVEARRNGAREQLGAALTDDQVAYVLKKKGLAWLERHYSGAAVA